MDISGTGPFVVNTVLGIIFSFTLADTVNRDDSVEIQFPVNSIINTNFAFSNNFNLNIGTYTASTGILTLTFFNAQTYYAGL